MPAHARSLSAHVRSITATGRIPGDWNWSVNVETIFYLQHGHAPGPFRTESVQAREDWKPQPKRGSVIACRFLVKFEGRWRRLYSDYAARGIPHFIMYRCERIAVDGVCP